MPKSFPAYIALAAVGIFSIATVFANPNPSKLPFEKQEARYSVETAVLPGHLSMTVFYITDHETGHLHIYRAMGGMDLKFNKQPELYDSFDLTSAGEKKLRKAEIKK